MRFLFSVNVYAFIPTVLFLWLKIVKKIGTYQNGVFI